MIKERDGQQSEIVIFTPGYGLKHKIVFLVFLGSVSKLRQPVTVFFNSICLSLTGLSY